ncbi:hypothetical protein Leryth_019228 [Lithospermum erythrorhizon]|nr:hypothetical protein Leryth_019228 [Lithospermum erythrorhizon]
MVTMRALAWKIFCIVLLVLETVSVTNGEDIFLVWHVAIDTTVQPANVDQPVITINGLFPGPMVNSSTNDNININVFNDMDEPLLLTWNGIQQRLNSWQDGVSGTNCPIMPGSNWTYAFQMKDQIGSFFYFPSINFQKAGGGFGAIRINNRIAINVPFPKPEAEFDLLIGDWFEESYKVVRSNMNIAPARMLMNGKGSYIDSSVKSYESFTVSPGKTYRFRISNVGTGWSFNFRIQNHKMLLVETEGSYTSQITLDSLDVHVGQSYSVLVTADQDCADYYIVASPKLFKGINETYQSAVGVFNYEASTTHAHGPLPLGPDPSNVEFSVSQARSIRWNLTAGAARPNPQGAFNVSNVTLTQTFILQGSLALIGGAPLYTINNVSYITPDTPLKLADQYLNGSGVYQLDAFPVNASLSAPVTGTFVVTGQHKGWLELVFENDLNSMDSWHLDGFSFFVVGFGEGKWNPELRWTYNLHDPVVRSTVQVYQKRWTAVYVYLDNPGMWNLRSQHLKQWYMGQELYIRVYNADPNPVKERQPPANILFCGKIQSPPSPPSLPPPPPSLPPSSATYTRHQWIVAILGLVTLYILW